MKLKAGDIVLIKGNSVGSVLIRFFSSSLFEGRTKVSHVGIIVTDGDIREAIIVEALSHVYRHSLWGRYGTKSSEIAVFRPLQLSKKDIGNVVAKAESYVGKSYGYFKIVTHLLDWCIGGFYLFRRLTVDDRYPICSWLVAAAYAEANETFNSKITKAEPDDIWDYCIEHTERFEMIRALSKLN